METHSNSPTIIMDDLAVQCKKKLETFRIKELKDVLSRIGEAKQGKKQVLVNKIMDIILSPDKRQFHPMGLKLESLSARHPRSRGGVAKVIDDIYRMRQFGAPDLATVVGNVPVGSVSLARSSEQDEVPNGGDSKTRCPCGNAMDSGTMIQCEDPNCLVWQHVNCVIIPEKEDMKPEIPTQFFCEMCRIQHGDPFCVSDAHPLLPTKTITTSVLGAVEGGSGTVQSLDASFTLSRDDRHKLCNQSYDLQIWCVLLGDEVAFRMHWPLKADLRVNGEFVRVTNRPGQQKLGANGRDDGPVITDHTREGLNRIAFSAYDGRSFCIGVRIIHRLTVDQVFRYIPSETQGERFDLALSRVRRCIVGGGGVGDDSDSDLEVVSEYITVNLRCPMSGSRMKMAGRFKPCIHMGCFDLRTFVELNQRARKWQCPICLKNYSLHDLIIDPFFTRITRALKSYGEDVTEVEMKPDGCWRPKLDGDAKFKESWRSPDGLIGLANGENKSTNFQGLLNVVKVEEGVSVERVPLKIGFKRTRDGTWQVNGIPCHLEGLAESYNMLGHNPQDIQNGVRSQSSTATASHEDSSVNQEPNEPLPHNQFRRDEFEVSSMFMEAPANDWPNGPIGGDLDQLKTSEIIVLSDTDEDNTNQCNLGPGRLTSFQTAPVAEIQGNGRGLASDFGRGFVHGGSERAVPFTEVGSTTVPLDLFGTSRGVMAPPIDQDDFWPTEAHNGPFELFSSASDVSTAPQSCHLPVCPTPLLAPRPMYMLSSQQSRENTMLETTYTDYNGETQSFMEQDHYNQVIEGTKGLASADPSLRNFLPHQPARSAVKPKVREPLVASDDGLRDGWFSLSLGGRESFPDAVAPLYEPSHERTQFDPLVDSASVLLDLSNHGTRADENTFTHRRAKGSTVDQPANHPRNYFRVDSDSD